MLEMGIVWTTIKLMNLVSSPTVSLADGEDRREVAPVSGSELRWVYWIGYGFVAWIVLAPSLWITSDLIDDRLNGRAFWFGLMAVIYCGWSLIGVRPALRELCYEIVKESTLDEFSGHWKAVYIFGLLLCALISMILADGRDPHGIQQFLWFPVCGFSVLLLRGKWIWLALFMGHLVPMICVGMMFSPNWGLVWFLAQGSISVFYVTCLFVAQHSARQRTQIFRMALELRDSNSQLEKQVDQASVLAVAQERNRLAREIHDSVGHSLTVVGAQLAAAEALLIQFPERALAAVKKAHASSQVGLEEIRRSVSALRVTPMEKGSLMESLPVLISGVERGDFKIQLKQHGVSRPLPALVELALYRCAQEGLTNACRHADAHFVIVSVDFSAHASVKIEIKDDGLGFANDVSMGHGLKGLQERATLLHGEFRFGRGDHGGGWCCLEIPA